MSNKRRDIAVVLASTMVIQSAVLGYFGNKAGFFDAVAKETTLRELRKEKLTIEQSKYLFDFEAAEQKEEDDMFVIQGADKPLPLIKVKKQTDAPNGLFEYRVAEPAAHRETTVHVKVEESFKEAKGAAVPASPVASPSEARCEKRFIVHYFKRGSSKLTRMVKDQLKEIIPQIIGAKQIIVEGFTCPLGSQRINDSLALNRARNVAKFLKAEGVNVSEFKGKGKSKYISEDEQVNRRVEINTK